MNSSKISIKINFIMNAILNISYIVFPLITFPYISRILLPEGTGKVAFANSVVNYFLLLSQLGVQTYGIRECAKKRDNREQLSKVVWELFTLNFLLTIAAYILLFLLLIFIPRFQEEKKLYLIMSMTIVFNTLGVHYLYKGLEQYSYITIRSILFKLIALILMFFLVHKKEDYIIYGAISVFAASASSVMNFWYSKKIVFFVRTELLNIKEHLRKMSVFFALDCATTIYTNLDTVMLGFLSENIEVGYYNAAVKIKILLISLITSLGAVLMPRITFFLSQGKLDEYKRTLSKAFNFVFVISVPLAIFFIIFAKECIYFLSGEAYKGSILPMRLIMPALIFCGLSNITSMEILIPNGKEKYVFKAQVVGIITNIILNIALIEKYRATGAAIATIIAEMLVLCIQFWYVKNELSNVICFAGLRIIFGGVFISTIGTCIFYNSYKNLNNNFFILFISALIFFFLYFFVLIASKEKLTLEVVNNFVEKIKNKKVKSK